jgi:hypothetical protein
LVLQTITEYRKGFNPTLYRAIDTALVSVLGREAVTTFYYHIAEKHNLLDQEFEQRPLEVLQYLEEILGRQGFRILTVPIIVQIRETFGVVDNATSIKRIVELAKKGYLLDDVKQKS